VRQMRSTTINDSGVNAWSNYVETQLRKTHFNHRRLMASVQMSRVGCTTVAPRPRREAVSMTSGHTDVGPSAHCAITQHVEYIYILFYFQRFTVRADTVLYRSFAYARAEWQTSGMSNTNAILILIRIY
jgi:hypothetical protein